MVAEGPEWDAMRKLLKQLHDRSDTEPFREAVDWRSLGIFDYPQIIKKPMDLGLVKRNIDAGVYTSIQDAADDIRLIWANCRKYNADESDFNKIARRLSKVFEEKFRNLLKDLKLDTPVAAAAAGMSCVVIGPSNEERREFAKLLFKIDPEQLGKVIIELDEKCPPAVVRNEPEDEAEVHVDLVTADVFYDLFSYVKKCGGDKGRVKKTSNKKQKVS
eukprot:CAMPEP_0172421506 /NCGR_PEP_ID=MMETSP1064-20121228/7747_1 /TAXON_ID=202472 /ORGANISM="Aulacoseira subarctica , Strain CCAP 1002/5" /LENGTH=216 /DNA_ID=CAMNT_0013161941 /DNA_START=121 /DNA_END=771 /DNA_ORIENTATION=-